MVGGFRADRPEVTQALAAARAAIGGATRARAQASRRGRKPGRRGGMFEAAERWEDILVDHPTDALALRLVQDAYFFLGQSHAIRDSVARVHARMGQGQSALRVSCSA